MEHVLKMTTTSRASVWNPTCHWARDRISEGQSPGQWASITAQWLTKVPLSVLSLGTFGRYTGSADGAPAPWHVARNRERHR